MTAAHLVERVLPHVPYRQWTLSFPHRVRWVLLKDVGLLSDVLTLFLRAVFALQRRRARRQGLRGGQAGAVSFIQFFGSALQVTPHFHSLVPDDGRLAYRMKRPLPDGTTHPFFTGLERLRRRTSLVPPPRANLTRRHGVFAPGAKLRRFLLPEAGEQEESVEPQTAERKESKACSAGSSAGATPAGVVVSPQK